MSSRFVSGGTTDAPIERSDEWLVAQQELEANRRRKAEESRQPGGRSLYETLEANKAAKQEAFEEANKLKNQFRSLDEDEIEFLDSVLESTRAEEERVRRETAEGLELFRRQQEEADKKLLASQRGDAGSPVEEDDWVAGGGGVRKRKRREKEGIKGVKLRRSSTSTIENPASSVEVPGPGVSEKGTSRKVAEGSPVTHAGSGVASKPVSKHDLKPKESPHSQRDAPAAPAAKGGLGLVDYGSDSDDD